MAELLDQILSQQLQAKPDTDPLYKRLSRGEERRILSLRAEGLTIEQIAAAIGRSTSTVHHTIESFTDTAELARQRLAAQAVDVAEHWGFLATKGKRYEACRDYLTHAGVIEPPAVQGGSNGHSVLVAIGLSADLSPTTFALDTVISKPVSD